MQHLDVALLDRQLLIFNDKERTDASTIIGVQPQLLQADVVHHANFDGDVELASERSERAHEIGGIAVHANPHTVDKNLRRVGDDARRNLLQVLHRPLLEELENGRGRRTDGDERHEGEVLHQAARLSLRGLRGAHHAPVRVVQLTRFGELALAAYGRVESSEVGQGGGERQAVEHLRHACADILRALRAPITRRERVFQPARDGLRLHRQRELNVLPAVHAPLAVQPDILGQLAEQLAEQHGNQRPREIHALVPEVIAIVLVASPQRAQQQPVHDVSQVVRLLRLAIFINPDVREELLLQNLPGVLDALISGHPHGAATLADEIQRHLLGLDHLRLLDGRAEEVHHLVVAKVVHNVLEDILVCHEAERAEHHEQGNLRADIRKSDANHAGLALGAGGVHQPRHAARRRPGTALRRRSALRHPHVLARLALLEDVHVVGAHLLLRDENLLGSVDDEVAALVVGALAELGELLVRVVVQRAVLGAKHDGHLADENLIDLLHLLGLVFGGGHGGDRFRHVDVEGRGVGQVTQARLLREEGARHAVRLGHHRLGEVDLAELHLVRLLLRRLRLLAGHVLMLGLELERGHLVYGFGGARGGGQRPERETTKKKTLGAVVRECAPMRDRARASDRDTHRRSPAWCAG